MKTVHLIGNAHLDPVWLWSWGAGLDEVLNTCETACNLLERHRDVVFTRGEAWVYEQIERLHPALFRRIQKLIKRGQWEVIGGWYLQPDCNFPSRIGFEKQVELGLKYFRRSLGVAPTIGYNVDSFGHSSFLPELMRRHGQTHYVMMRPMDGEMPLAARLFRWRGYAGGPEVTVFRIAGSYCTSAGITLEHVEQSLTGLPDGVEDTMCFVGVGDHGGGMTEKLVEWCRAHRDAIPGARLEFSSVARFFNKVKRARLPLVTGDLQQHAIGCYSAHRAVKTAVRESEHALARAEHALTVMPRRLQAEYRAALDKAWAWLCFNHFHDTLGGTCVPSAYRPVRAQLGHSLAVADEIQQTAARARVVAMPPAERQRLVLVNDADAEFDGWVEHEPWLEWTAWQPDWRLADERGRTVPHQLLDNEAAFANNGAPRLLFRVKVPAHGQRVLGLAQGTVTKAQSLATAPVAPPELVLVEETSDTWSHALHAYEGREMERVVWSDATLMDDGPLMAAWEYTGRAGSSTFRAEWRAYRGASYWELRLRAHWAERRRLLRLNWRPGAIISRTDGGAGRGLERQPDGWEYPVQDWSLLRLKDGGSAGVVMPDTFSASATPEALRLTLLRSPYMAEHDHELPNRITGRHTVLDQGEHEFLFHFYTGGAPERVLRRDALMLHNPLTVAETTKGMPCRPLKQEVAGRVC